MHVHSKILSITFSHHPLLVDYRISIYLIDIGRHSSGFLCAVVKHHGLDHSVIGTELSITWYTVRKLRYNEHQILKQRKEALLLKKTHLLQHVCGIEGSIASNSCVDKSRGVAMDMERKGRQRIWSVIGSLNMMSSWS